MSSYLQAQIKIRMEAKNLSIYALEKKAGLKRSAVRNIIQGFSKKPGAEVLLAIAQILECTVEDLAGSTHHNHPVHIETPSTIRKAQHTWDESLFLDSIAVVSKCLDNKDTTLEQMLPIILEAYKYSIGKNSNKADVDFVKWLINKGL
jgi:transcriptional regulator with XRE-family HTH domain